MKSVADALLLAASVVCPVSRTTLVPLYRAMPVPPASFTVAQPCVAAAAVVVMALPLAFPPRPWERSMLIVAPVVLLVVLGAAGFFEVLR